MIGLEVREEDVPKVKRILRRFQIAFEEMKESTVFMLSDRFNAINLLFYLFYKGIKAKLLLYI